MAGTAPQKTARDYIVFALDLPGLAAARPYIERLSGAVGMFKVGLELFVREGPEIVRVIQRTGGTPVFLDLKLHDIPETVRRTVAGMADLGVAYTSVHCGEQPAMLEAAVAGSSGRVGILAVTLLTSVGTGPDGGADVETLVVHRAAAAAAAGCRGVVCSGKEAAAVRRACGPRLTVVTPGIRPPQAGKNTDDQRRVTTPAQAVAAGADYLVIGRPIRDAPDPLAAVRRIAGQVEDALRNSGPISRQRSSGTPQLPE